MKRRKKAGIDQLIGIMARLRSKTGCPWDREQTHKTLRWHAVEEVYELLDAIEKRDDQELLEELGDLLLQVVFHCQLARERGAFNFDDAARHISEKLIRRHPHVFGTLKVKGVDEVWANWEQIKKAEKHGTRHARASALDGIPRRLPALMRAEKLLKKAQRAGLTKNARGGRRSKAKATGLAKSLFRLVEQAREQGYSAEDLLRAETFRVEKSFRKLERGRGDKAEGS